MISVEHRVTMNFLISDLASHLLQRASCSSWGTPSSADWSSSQPKSQQRKNDTGKQHVVAWLSLNKNVWVLAFTNKCFTDGPLWKSPAHKYKSRGLPFQRLLSEIYLSNSNYCVMKNNWYNNWLNESKLFYLSGIKMPFILKFSGWSKIQKIYFICYFVLYAIT